MARHFAERKPLLAVVGGRSSGGQRAGASHTAAAAASGVGVDALFAQAGVIGCRSAEELAETALLVTGQSLPVLVQPVVSGVELALGVVRDPGFGPLVMVAAGGVATDLLADRVFLLPPLTRGDAGRALRSLRSWPLLDGFRGTPRVDVESLEGLILALGALATDVTEVAELDLNPVVVSPDGCALVDVKVRLATASPLDAGVPRRLRRPR